MVGCSSWASFEWTGEERAFCQDFPCKTDHQVEWSRIKSELSQNWVACQVSASQVMLDSSHWQVSQVCPCQLKSNSIVKSKSSHSYAVKSSRSQVGIKYSLIERESIHFSGQLNSAETEVGANSFNSTWSKSRLEPILNQFGSESQLKLEPSQIGLNSMWVTLIKSESNQLRVNSIKSQLKVELTQGLLKLESSQVRVTSGQS